MLWELGLLVIVLKLYLLFSIEQCVISQKSKRSLPGVVRLLLDKFVAEGVKGAARNWLARFL